MVEPLKLRNDRALAFSVSWFPLVAFSAFAFGFAFTLAFSLEWSSVWVNLHAFGRGAVHFWKDEKRPVAFFAHQIMHEARRLARCQNQVKSPWSVLPDPLDQISDLEPLWQSPACCECGECSVAWGELLCFTLRCLIVAWAGFGLLLQSHWLCVHEARYPGFVGCCWCCWYFRDDVSSKTIYHFGFVVEIGLVFLNTFPF